KNEDPREAYPREERSRYNNRNEYRPEEDNKTNQQRVQTPSDEDVEINQNRETEYGYNQESKVRGADIESTRKCSRIEEDDTHLVDNNIDLKNNGEPVTNREYNPQSGIDTEELNEIDREDPARTRRDNVDRRNRK